MTKLILALDTEGPGEINELLRDLAPLVDWVKLGYQAICSLGLASLTELCKLLGYNVFVDLKFHDTPSAVGNHVHTLTQYGVQMLNVHTMGGLSMMEAAKAEAASRPDPPIVLGVTVLTSQVISINAVVKLAENAQRAGLDGVVCSPLEAHAIRKACGDDFLIVSPGIRPLWAPAADQARYTTPSEATDSDYIVVGRPILYALDPVKATELILEELGG